MSERTDLVEAIRRDVRAVLPPRGVDIQMMYLVGAPEADPRRLVRDLGWPGSPSGLSLAVPTVPTTRTPLHRIT